MSVGESTKEGGVIDGVASDLPSRIAQVALQRRLSQERRSNLGAATCRRGAANSLASGQWRQCGPSVDRKTPNGRLARRPVAAMTQGGKVPATSAGVWGGSLVHATGL